MANQTPSAFMRIFADRSLYQGAVRWAIFWSAISAVALTFLVITAAVLIGLLIDQGAFSLRLNAAAVEEFNDVTGLEMRSGLESPTADQPAEDDPEAPSEAASTPTVDAWQMHTVEGEGIVRSVWESRGHWWGPLLARIYRGTLLLHQNDLALLTLLVTAAGLGVLHWFCIRQVRLHSERAAQRIGIVLRKHLHRQALRLSPEDIDEQSSQQAVQLFMKQVDAVRDSVRDWLYRIIRFPGEILCGLLIAWNVNALLFIQWALPVGLCWYLLGRAYHRWTESQRLAEDRLSDEYQALSEQLLNARLVRGFGMEQSEHDDFLKRLDRTLAPLKDLSPSQREAFWLRRLAAVSCILTALFMSLSLGMKLLHSPDELGLPGATAFILATGIVLYGARQLWGLRAARTKGAVAADQIYRYLDRMPSVSQAVGAKFLQPMTRSLHFDAVTYRAPNQEMLLDRVTLRLEAGKSYAVVSMNPLEAKAFVLMLPRFLEPQSGRILYDGEDIAWATLESLRAEAVFVGGDDPPLRGSVLDNLRAGASQYTLQQATEAAKQARAHNFLIRLPQGYETVLDGRSEELEVGQRFRLALARALLRDPALLIIEEPQVDFDEDTKQLLDDAYQRIMPGRTIVFLPSRLSTLKRVDQVIMLSNGQLVGQNAQSELLSLSPLYRHWEYLHFNEFRRLNGTSDKV